MNNDSWIIIADEVSSSVLVSMARQTGGKVTAIVAGSQECAITVADSGVDHVLWYETDNIIPAEAWMDAIADAAVQAKPRLVLSANLPVARVLVGAVAARLNAVTASSILSITLNGDQMEVTRLVADGRAVEVLNTYAAVAGMIVEGGEEQRIFEKTAEIATIKRVETEEKLIITGATAESGGADLSSADRVVGAGAGIGSKDKIALVEELADAFHAKLACSLPLCDNYRWFEHSRVVGSSTQKISPRIYLMVGISGQPQHMMGVRGAKTIVAINHDPDAPIFRKCNYGIVGDLNQIVPALTVALRDIWKR